VSSPIDPTRDAILDAALRLIESEGAEAVRMEDVARVAGVSRQAVYLHVGSRSGLFLALVERLDATRGLGRLQERLEKARTPMQLLRRALELQAEYFPLIKGVALPIESSRYGDAAVAAAWQDRMDARRKQMRRLVEWFHAESLLLAGLTIDAATDLVWSLCSFTVWHNLVIDCGWTKADYVEHMVRVLAGAIVRPRTRHARGRRGAPA
jgi:AcrR family transcriptional regulator